MTRRWLPCWHTLVFGRVLEIAGLYNVRSFKDGLTLFSLDIGLDLYESEHNPKAGIRLMFINCIVFEVSIYQTKRGTDDTAYPGG